MKIPLKYNIRSLFVRKGTTFMTMFSIAFVVLVFIGVFSLGVGLEKAFRASGDPDTLIVLRDGARSETESAQGMDVFRDIATLPGIEIDAEGKPLASGEVIILQIFERDDGSESNVVVRGVGDAAREVRPQWSIVEGRDFEPGKGEIVVGRRLVGRFTGFEIGQSVTLGRMDFRIVGIFEAGEGSAESEVWGAIADIGDSFRRSNYVSSIRLRTTSAASAATLTETIEGDQRWRIAVKSEMQYYEEQSAANTQQFKILGLLLAVLMGFGACFAAANTMYAQIANRGREIGTLRALGFKRGSILTAFLLEAAFLGFFGGLVGVLLSLPLNGLKAGTTNFLTFSEITFELALTPPVLAGGVLLAVITGIVGGLPAAWAASRRQITGLLRET
ncbi:MAG: ABC transporter permease [Acidobacteriota bacterium]